MADTKKLISTAKPEIQAAAIVAAATLCASNSNRMQSATTIAEEARRILDELEKGNPEVRVGAI